LRFFLNSRKQQTYFRRATHGARSAFYTPQYRCADKSLARPGRKQATATEDFDVHLSYLLP